MSSESKKPSEKQIQEQAKKSDEKCDYLHPEQCADGRKENLDKTRKEVEETAEQFIDENESDEE
jgi:hypothetical protein